MYPEIPEDRSGMTAAELRALRDEVKAAGRAALAEDDTVTAKRAAKDVAMLEAEAAKLDLADALAEDETPDPPADPVPAPPADPPADPEAAAPTATIVVTEPVPAAAAPVPVGTSLAGDDEPGITPGRLVAAEDFKGVSKGHAFQDWGQFVEASIEKAGDLSPQSGERYPIARINANYPEDRQLTDVALENLKFFNGMVDAHRRGGELKAAFCPLPTPVYDMDCANILARPVAGSLANYAAPRGAVTLHRSPSLASVAGSAGIWTTEDDADDEALKNDCAVIACPPTETFEMWLVYWCLTVKNMMNMTFPELVAAYLNRGTANYVRLAEIQLLDAMGAAVPDLTVTATAYGASTHFATALLTYLAKYREIERWDNVPMHMWAPRWFRVALQLDLSRRRRSDGSWRIATEAEVDQVFRDANVNVTWYLDTPSWGVGPGALATGANASVNLAGTLEQLPTTVSVLVAPEGKFAMIDRGNLSFGVQGQNWFRDIGSLKRNDVTYFVESAEGVVDTSTCGGNVLNFSGLCYSGVQIDDLAIGCDLEAA